MRKVKPELIRFMGLEHLAIKTERLHSVFLILQGNASVVLAKQDRCILLIGNEFEHNALRDSSNAALKQRNFLCRRLMEVSRQVPHASQGEMSRQIC